MSTFSTYINSKRHGIVVLALFAVGISLISLLAGPFNLLSHPSDFEGQLLTYLTYSAGSEGFLVTLAVFTLGMFLTSDRKGHFIKLCVCFGVLLVLCFAGKTGLKKLTQSPRPYTETLVQLKLVDSAQDFYAHDKYAQNALVMSAKDEVSPYRINHWKHETDYSFPSGHTVFVAVCLAFFGGLAAVQKRYTITGLMLVWALGVAYSRLWLGMHRPEDLFGSMAFVALLYLIIPIPKAK
ncbi:phosphatase PAP2 family protein [Vibrio gallicus]|uniref:phosphatase PAP2 family protein n=1 Tax=Vibrio gallicus TaxID=190897 RepID=UPI0021C2CC61|nr:phosphatase PAP2 family protein [Vibrio gallicus]